MVPNNRMLGVLDRQRSKTFPSWPSDLQDQEVGPSFLAGANSIGPKVSSSRTGS